MYLENNLENFYRAGYFKMVHKIINKIDMIECPALEQLWRGVMNDLSEDLRLSSEDDVLHRELVRLISVFLSSEYFDTCSRLRDYEYKPYLIACCRRLVKAHSSILLEDLFKTKLFKNDYREGDLLIMIKENVPLKYIEEYRKIAKKEWDTSPVQKTEEIIVNETFIKDGSAFITDRGEGLLKIFLKDDPKCPSYEECFDQIPWLKKEKREIYNKICEIYYEINKENFREEFNA